LAQGSGVGRPAAAGAMASISAMFDSMADAKEEQGKGKVVYQECKVIDGESFLVNVVDNSTKQVLTFEAFSTETTEIFPCEWEYGEFDKVFRFNAELMNPNKREGRYHWIIERLAFCSDGKGGRKLIQQPGATDAIPQKPIREFAAKIPTGRLNYAERAKLREDMDRLERTRTENIKRKREATRERFLQWVDAVRQDVARKKAERAATVKAEQEQRLADQVEQRRVEEQERLRMQQLEEERESRIEAREQDRRKRWDAGIRNLIEEGRLQAEQRQAAIDFAVEKKHAADDYAREEARQEKARLEALEQKRDNEFDKRQHRQWKKGQAWLLKRDETMKGLARDEEVRNQRRVDTQHRFNLARTKAYQAYIAKKTERDRIMQVEKAFERTLDDGKEVKAKVSADERERAAQRALSETAAREKLEEHRRLAKLERQRDKAITLAEKRRSENEVRRHERYVEDFTKAEQDALATIADHVRAFKERDQVSKAAASRKANDRKRLEKLRAENIQRRNAEKMVVA